MKKHLLAAAVTAAVMAGNAHAALPVISSDTTVVYLSGASASLDFINKLITLNNGPADSFCDSTSQIWRYNDQIDGKQQNAFYCKTNQSNALLKNKVKANILVYKRSEGGSAMGVNPLINNDQISYLNLNSCVQTTQAVAGSTVGVATCTYDPQLQNANQYTIKTSDFGMSDVEPGKFTGVNTPAGFEPITADNVQALEIFGASAVTFGEPVTLQLYKALQKAQGIDLKPGCSIGSKTEACMPNLTSAQIATIHTGSWTSWNSIKVGSTGEGLYDWVTNPANNATAYAPAVADIHICRRVDGSGTQAQHNAVFLNLPCTDASAATPPASEVEGVNEGDGFTMVHNMSESGGVTNCLKELDTATNAANAFNNQWTSGVRWAVGIQSLEKSDANFEFVKVDGVAPTLAHVADGSYRDWVENTFQYNRGYFSSIAADKQALATAIIKKSSLPQVMASLNATFTHGFGNGAYLAVPSLFTPAANGELNPALPVNPYSRATSAASVDNCRVPTIYSSGDAKL